MSEAFSFSTKRLIHNVMTTQSLNLIKWTVIKQKSCDIALTLALSNMQTTAKSKLIFANLFE